MGDWVKLHNVFYEYFFPFVSHIKKCYKYSE